MVTVCCDAMNDVRFDNDNGSAADREALIEYDRVTGLHFLLTRMKPTMTGLAIDFCPWCGAALRPLN